MKKVLVLFSAFCWSGQFLGVKRTTKLIGAIALPRAVRASAMGDLFVDYSNFTKDLQPVLAGVVIGRQDRAERLAKREFVEVQEFGALSKEQEQALLVDSCEAMSDLTEAVSGVNKVIEILVAQGFDKKFLDPQILFLLANWQEMVLDLQRLCKGFLLGDESAATLKQKIGQLDFATAKLDSVVTLRDIEIYL